MNEDLKEAVRNNVCFHFLNPSSDKECGGKNVESCHACAKDFIKGWEARSASKEVLK